MPKLSHDIAHTCIMQWERHEHNIWIWNVQFVVIDRIEAHCQRQTVTERHILLCCDGRLVGQPSRLPFQRIECSNALTLLSAVWTVWHRLAEALRVVIYIFTNRINLLYSKFFVFHWIPRQTNRQCARQSTVLAFSFSPNFALSENVEDNFSSENQWNSVNFSPIAHWRTGLACIEINSIENETITMESDERMEKMNLFELVWRRVHRWAAIRLREKRERHFDSLLFVFVSVLFLCSSKRNNWNEALR